MEFVKTQEALEGIIDKYADLVASEYKNLKSEYSLQSSQQIKEVLSRMDDENRLLQIGIVGRVKAGKSSLLNALLFDGKSILPKAATPMTAALTVISYGDMPSAEVEFFTASDIENIKKEAEQYQSTLKIETEKRLKELKDSKKSKDTPEVELREKARKTAERNLKENIALSASYEQYMTIMSSEIDHFSIENSKKIEINELSHLGEMLSDYVGSDGKYTPFTKSVHIKIPLEKLQNIQIVDTPGVNDPVRSRESRTRELLKFCDVVLVVSPSGQFMSAEDIDLMDRITSKEGIRELYAVSSQVDLQLFGSIKAESDGDIHKALGLVKNSLAEHLHSTLTALKKSNPEIGNVYDQLIEQSRNKIVHSSGICQTIRNEWENKERWDDGTQTAWENLTRHYPDYFSDTDKELSMSNLDLLANISEVEQIVVSVKEKKDEILKKRIEEFLSSKKDSFVKSKEKLLSYIKTQMHEIDTGDINKLREKLKRSTDLKAKATDAIENEFDGLIDIFGQGIKQDINAILEKYFKDSKHLIEDEKKEKTESYKVESDGFLAGFERFFGAGGYETRYETVPVVVSGAVHSHILAFRTEIENEISSRVEDLILESKKQFSSGLIGVIRRDISDDYLDANTIKKAVRTILNNIDIPNISYDDKLPDNLSPRGMLRRDDAEQYIVEAIAYIKGLKLTIGQTANKYIKELCESLKDINITDDILAGYRKELDTLKHQIETKEATIDKYERLKKELEGIK